MAIDHGAALVKRLLHSDDTGRASGCFLAMAASV